MRSLRPAAIALALLALAATVYLVLRPPSSNSGAGSPRAITIAQFGDFFLYAPLYVALDGGYFEAEGLKVTLISTGGDEKTWAAVMSGNAAFGVADPTFVAVSGARGNPGVVVATIIPKVPFWGITFRTDLKPFSGASDLGSLRVATFPSPSTAYTLQRKMFQGANLEPSIRQGAFGTLIPMLRAGEADVALELEPNVATATKEGAVVLYGLHELYGDFATTGLTTNPSTIADDPELVGKVVCAIQRAISAIHRDPEASLALLANRFPEVNPDVARAAFTRSVEAGIFPLDCITAPIAWERAIDVRRAVGDLTSPAPFAQYVDNSFAEKAKATCSTAK